MSLWKEHKKGNNYISPQSRKITHKQISTKIDKEASFCTCHKASLTVEVAVVVPLVAGFFVSLLFFFRVIQVQARIEEALLYAGRKMAVEASVLEDEVLLYASARGFLEQALKEEPIIERYVAYGTYGIFLMAPHLDEEEVTMRVYYEVKFPIAFFGLDGIHLWSRGTFRKWVGDQTKKETVTGEWVYVTATGTAYHATDTCQSVRVRVYKTDMAKIGGLRGKNEQKYYLCSRCAEENDSATEVYYTDYGSLYHTSLDCAYIKRTVEKIPISEIGQRTPCSYCYP